MKQTAKRLCVLAGAAVLCLTLAGCFKSREETPESSLPTETTAATTTTAPVTTAATTPTTAPTPVGFNEYPATGYATDSLNVRRDASTNYTAIGGLAYGEQVTVLGKEGDWYKIRFVWTEESGAAHDTAYISAQYLSAIPPSATTTAAPVTTAATTAATTAPVAE